MYLRTYLLLLYYGYPSLLENTIPFFLPIISLSVSFFFSFLYLLFIIHTQDEPYNLTILNIFVVEGRCKFLLCPELFDTDGVHMTIVFFFSLLASLTLIQDYLQFLFIFFFIFKWNKQNDSHLSPSTNEKCIQGSQVTPSISMYHYLR